MNYLIDTCVLSELKKRNSDEHVIAWIGGIEESRLYLSVIIFGEIQKGISKLEDSPKKQALQIWLEQDLMERFEQRILDVDIEAAIKWGNLHGAAELRGSPAPVVDCLIAATAMVHNLIVATRNVSDFRRFPVTVFNPWD